VPAARCPRELTLWEGFWIPGQDYPVPASLNLSAWRKAAELHWYVSVCRGHFGPFENIIQGLSIRLVARPRPGQPWPP